MKEDTVYYIVLMLLLIFSAPLYAATGISITSQGASGAGVCSKTVSVSSDQLKDWHNTPIEIVPTAGVGNIILPKQVSTQFIPGAVAYAKVVGQANHPILFLDTFTSSVAPVLNGLLTSIATFTTSDGPQNMFFPLGESAQVWNPGTDKSLKMKLIPTQQLTLGDGTLIVTTTYEVHDSSGNVVGTCPGGNPPPPVAQTPHSDEIDVATYANVGSTGVTENPWSGWEVILATNRDAATCTTPAGYSVPTCLWPSGKKYYFRAGKYYQVYPIATVHPNNTLDHPVAPSNTHFEGPARGLASVTYNPINDGTSQYTLGQLGTHTLNVSFRRMTSIGYSDPNPPYTSNPYTKVMIHTIDTTGVNIEQNTFGNWCDGNSRGIWLQGREFVWVNENRGTAVFPFYVDGQPVPADGGALDGNPYNNVGYSRFNNNEFLACDWDHPAIYIGATTILNDVVFSGNSTIFGSDNFKWVQNFTGISDPNRKAVSHNVVIENFDWEQTANNGNAVPGDLGKTGNGWFVHIDQSNGNAYGLTGLTIRDNHYGSFIGLAAGYTINGVRLLNVHDVRIEGLHQALGASVCGRVLDLTNVHNVLVTGMEVLPLPTSPSEVVTACTGSPNFITNQIGLLPPVCKTWQVPLSAAHGGKNTNIPAAAYYDTPASGGSCL